MSVYLPIPETEGVDLSKISNFKKFLPEYNSLNDWQKNRYDLMIEQYKERQPYLHSSGHHGCIWNNYFREKEILMDNDVDGVYCCGLGFEGFFNSWERWMDDWFESELDLTYKQMVEIFERYFVYKKRNDNTFRSGCGYAIERMGQMLKERWAKAKEKDPELGEFEEDFGAEFVYHTDIYEAKFGDDIQIQNKSDIFEPGGGHMVTFVGLEKRKRHGEMKDAVRAFQANYGGDYGMASGVNFGWFLIDFTKDGFKRKFHIGSIRPT